MISDRLRERVGRTGEDALEGVRQEVEHAVTVLYRPPGLADVCRVDASSVAKGREGVSERQPGSAWIDAGEVGDGLPIEENLVANTLLVASEIDRDPTEDGGSAHGIPRRAVDARKERERVRRFVPRAPSAEEGDGYLLGVATDLSKNTSELVIADTRLFGSGPIARVQLPFLSDFQVHGAWFTAADRPRLS
ncbi:MAG TPA: carotenoid oxygenase family protein [Acidimicrobiales bacterium]